MPRHKSYFSFTLPDLLKSRSEIGNGLFLRGLFGWVEENIKFWLIHCSAGTSAGKQEKILLSFSTLFYLFGGPVLDASSSDRFPYWYGCAHFLTFF